MLTRLYDDMQKCFCRPVPRVSHTISMPPTRDGVDFIAASRASGLTARRSATAQQMSAGKAANAPNAADNIARLPRISFYIVNFLASRMHTKP